MELELKASACRVQPVSQGLNYLGLQVFPSVLRLQGKRLRRTRRLVLQREKQFDAGELTETEIGAVCWLGARIARFLRVQ